MSLPLRHFPLLVCLIWAPAIQAAEVTVAVASNFLPVMKEIKRRFEAASGHRIVLVSGSTGKHYAQIRHGAPFDAFLAADQRRPALLEQAGIGMAGSRFTYAIGRIVLWSPKPGYIDDKGNIPANIRFLAIANPKLAPYGLAARQFLVRRGLWKRLQGRIVQGENIAQAWQYVASGNAEAGMGALSQRRQSDHNLSGSFWIVPDGLYQPVRQDAIALNRKPATRALLAFLRSAAVRRLISRQGYSVP